MESVLSVIEGKKSDYKVCVDCSAINWYENEGCHNCGCPEFDNSTERLNKWIRAEYKFWIEIEKYTETEADDVPITTG